MGRIGEPIWRRAKNSSTGLSPWISFVPLVVEMPIGLYQPVEQTLVIQLPSVHPLYEPAEERV